MAASLEACTWRVRCRCSVHAALRTEAGELPGVSWRFGARGLDHQHAGLATTPQMRIRLTPLQHLLSRCIIDVK
jgi:hypothetical protein